jgi:hypothetical protein
MSDAKHTPAIEAIPEWAMEAAKELENIGCGCTEEMSDTCAEMGLICMRSRNAIARAIVATDAAATAKERERIADNVAEKSREFMENSLKFYNRGNHVTANEYSHLSGAYASLSAAIRKGDE